MSDNSIENIKFNIKMVKGYDKNNNPFTAVLLLTNENEINQNDFCGNSVDLTKYNIIYKKFGHDLDEKMISDIIREYFDKTQ
jgi:hypothetical protein